MTDIFYTYTHTNVFRGVCLGEFVFTRMFSDVMECGKEGTNQDGEEV